MPMKRKTVKYDMKQQARMERAYKVWRKSTSASISSREVICKEWMAGNLSLIVSVPQTATRGNPDRPKFLGGE